jgi:FdhD protein
MRSLKIVRVQGDRAESQEDLVTEEISLRLLAGHRRVAELMCSPADLEDLVRGFFYTNGFIQEAAQILRIVINRATESAFIELAPEIDPGSFRLSGVIGSACGSTLPADQGFNEEVEEDSKASSSPTTGRVVAAQIQVGSEYISALMEEFRGHSEIHRQTGGVHAAALADREALLVFREDIGRHNAVDKVIGAYLIHGNNFDDKLLLSSGRLSSEILHKVAACGLPIVVSRSAPTDRCVALAREQNITLVGFARSKRMNIYSGGERISVRFDDL